MDRDIPAASLSKARDVSYMRAALALACRGQGCTSPNPMVGAVLVRQGKVIGQGWHRRAGEPHAEIEALRNARANGHNPKGSTLYVTLEPCSTFGRTPPCTDAIIAAEIKKVVVAATDPNPVHSGKSFQLLQCARIRVVHGILAADARLLNESFNHWIVHRTPFVTVKAAMTLDGKIATTTGKSKWITGEKARDYAMKLRRGADAILAGINTVLADDPALTFRKNPGSKFHALPKRRIILDSNARTPLNAKVVADEFRELTTLVVSRAAPQKRVTTLAERVRIVIAPERRGKIDLHWLMKKLGVEGVTSLLVEGGGEVNASFLLEGLAHRVAFFYAPRVIGGRNSRKAVGGEGIRRVLDAIKLRDVEWRRLGPDLLLTARVDED